MRGLRCSLLIADFSRVWVVCDVYENTLRAVHLGQAASVRFSAFPGQNFAGTVSDIGALLDPSLRTAKVRIQVANPGGLLRVGMFANVSLLGAQAASVTVVPDAAILHLHDQEYVFVPAGDARNISAGAGEERAGRGRCGGRCGGWRRDCG